MVKFIKTGFCATGAFCRNCRGPDADTWYALWGKQFEMPEGFSAREGESPEQTAARRQEACPKKLPMAPPEPARATAAKKPVPPEKPTRPPIQKKSSLVQLTVKKTHGGIVIEAPPTPTAKMIASFAEAALLGKYVSPDVQAEREATCATCPYARYSLKEDGPWCSICGCGTGGNGRQRIRKVTAYEENLPKWGCHHPKRMSGGGWRR